MTEDYAEDMTFPFSSGMEAPSTLNLKGSWFALKTPADVTEDGTINAGQIAQRN